MDELERSVMWHRFISEADLSDFYDVQRFTTCKNLDEYDQLMHTEKKIREMKKQLILFSESNPQTINEATDEMKKLLYLTLPKFLRKYPQYKGEGCLKRGGET